MFYGPSRQELTCIGFAIFIRQGDKIQQKNIVCLTDIIEHTSLATAEFFRDILEHVGPKGSLKHISFWHDCGGHFRSYSHVAFLIAEVFKEYKCSIRICFFGEKHGKGEVDRIFAHVQGWLNTYLRKGKSQIISSLADLIAVCEAGAKADAERDPDHVTWKVHHLVRECKPDFQWTLSNPSFQIQKTYCIQVDPYDGKNFDGPLLRDLVFSDVAVGAIQAKPHVAVLQKEPIEDRTWRRGYFTNRNWLQQKPARGETNSVLARRDDHKKRQVPKQTACSEWQNTAARLARRLKARREKWQRLLQAAPGSSSSSSSEGSSSSSEDS